MIDGLKRADIRRDQGLAVGPMTIERVGGVNAEQFLEGCGVEVVISLDGDLVDAATRSELYLEEEDHLALDLRIAVGD